MIDSSEEIGINPIEQYWDARKLIWARDAPVLARQGKFTIARISNTYMNVYRAVLCYQIFDYSQ